MKLPKVKFTAASWQTIRNSNKHTGEKGTVFLWKIIV